MTYLCIRVSIEYERRSKRFFKKFLKKKSSENLEVSKI